MKGELVSDFVNANTCVWSQSFISGHGAEKLLIRYFKGASLGPTLPNLNPLFAQMVDLGSSFYAQRLSTTGTLYSAIVDESRTVDIARLCLTLVQSLGNFHDILATIRSYPFTPLALRRFDKYIDRSLHDKEWFALRGCFDELEDKVKIDLGYDVRLLCSFVTEISTLVHGNFSFGNIFLYNGNISCIPAGPEAGMSYPEMDIGWLVGELLELLILNIIDEMLFLKLSKILVNGYVDKRQRSLDINLVKLFAIVRVALHCCDYFCSFGGYQHSLALFCALLNVPSHFLEVSDDE